MPKQEQKSRGEKTAENFFPVDEEDLKKTTEKIVKEDLPKEEILKKSIEIPVKKQIEGNEILKRSVEKKYFVVNKNSLEKIESTPVKKKRKYKRRKSSKKGKSRSVFKNVKYVAPKILFKKGGYELIITEKPQAALKIASALGDATQRTINKTNYYEVDRKGKKIIVACAVGHLFTLGQNISGSSVPIFDISWKPNYLVRKNDFTKKYFDTILSVAKNAGSLVMATDYDIEGEVIGWNVVRFICGQKDAFRMKFSTLTKEELNKAYDEKFSQIDWGQAIAGETRHYLDWFYGINLSRALMNSIKSTGRFKLMSIGRVQGPTLKLIVDKEKEIQAFKSEPYWQIFITVDDGKHKLELKHNKDIFEKNDLKKFDNLVGKKVKLKTDKRPQKIPPNPPFNLTSLQTEAYKFHGITPSNTLRAAQSLYLAGLISYPRTSSQKLPDSIGYKEILNKLSKKYKVEKLIVRNKPVEGSKTDPAHPSIYPTGNESILSGDEEKIYNLIVKRFLSLFCDDAIIDNKKVKTEIDKLIFSSRGSLVRKKGWMEIYPYKIKEVMIPDMKEDAEIIDLKKEEKETQPPRRFSPASILSELEKRNLGTKATRASILETLYDRGYIKGTSVEATPLGISIIDTLSKYSSIIIDEKLTRHFEKEMEAIRKAKKNFFNLQDITIKQAKKIISNIAEDFSKNEKKIGEALLKANDNWIEIQKKENTLRECPKCGKGSLAIIYSKKTRKHFIACNAYPKCRNTFSLPPNGVIKKTDKVCEKCGFLMLMRLQKGKRPWVFCFNTECESNKERMDAYAKKTNEIGKNK